jgi:hypothetical protein
VNIKRTIGIVVAIVIGLCIALDFLVTVVLRERLYSLYTQELDAWVQNGGPQDKIQSNVIPDCAELVVSQAGPVRAFLLLFDSDDRDFRADVCLQVTVNRVYPQPILQDPKMVAMVCESKNDLFRRLCVHAGLKS